MFKLNHIILLIATALVFSSCEKVIDLDLKSSDSRIVIEGNIADSLGQIVVKISKSVNYNTNNEFPTVSNAVVKVTDDQGQVYNLSETSSGKYVSSDLLLTNNQTYNLSVFAEGNTYVATSYMPVPVGIDSLGIEVINGFGIKDRKFVNVFFTDPLATTNYYQVIEYVNGKKTNDIFYDNDEFREGKKITFTTFNNDDDLILEKGDVVQISLLSIDKASYEYFRTLAGIYVNSGGGQTTPANPTSNISNNSLGYFSAHSVTTKVIIIP